MFLLSENVHHEMQTEMPGDRQVASVGELGEVPSSERICFAYALHTYNYSLLSQRKVFSPFFLKREVLLV